MVTASACEIRKTPRRRLQNPTLLRELEREFGESPAEVAHMSDTELRAYLAVLWDRRARGTDEGGAG